MGESRGTSDSSEIVRGELDHPVGFGALEIKYQKLVPTPQSVLYRTVRELHKSHLDSVPGRIDRGQVAVNVAVCMV